MSKVLFCLSGSISAFKACQVISKLAQDGHEVQTVVTPGALHFIGTATLEGLTGRPVLTDLWQDAMAHVELTRWADYAVLCPASANACARLANGLADDLVGALALAWPREKPFHVFPAMNTQMLTAPATQTNLARLRERGFRVHDADKGALACGETGEGRLPEPEQILKTLAPAPKGRVLVTAGATREPVDGIRFLSNVSTGQTGASIAQNLTALGWRVTYLHGVGALKPAGIAHAVTFTDFDSLDKWLRTELDQRDYKGVVHAAAVGDYRVENRDPSVKLPSGEPITLNLTPNPKLLPKLRGYSRNRQTRVIGFKLTLGAEETSIERARELLGPNVDAVVANDWTQVERDRARHPGALVRADGSETFQTLDELTRSLDRLLQGEA